MVVHILPVILAGGAGSRLWPLSTPDFPKPLLAPEGDNTLLKQTLDRLMALDVKFVSAPLLVCARHHALQLMKEADGRFAACIAEPEGKNTGPAVVAAVQWARQHMAQILPPQTLMLVLPCDHLITPVGAFHEALMRAVKVAQQCYLVAIGLAPSEPSPHYGYMLKGEILPQTDSWRIGRFHEKPTQPQAQDYVTQGALCNSGMFVWPLELIAQECRQWAAATWQQCDSAMQAGAWQQGCFVPHSGIWSGLDATPVDRMIMERTQRAAVVQGRFQWSDMGSFEAWWQALSKDAQGNVGQGPVTLTDCTHCLCINRTSEPMQIARMHNMCIVRTEAGELSRPMAL